MEKWSLTADAPFAEAPHVLLSQTGSELPFDVFSRRYDNAATIVTSHLPFQGWTSVFARERLTGALLDRITHHVHILELNRRELPAQAEPIPTPGSVRITPLDRAGRGQSRSGRVAPRAGSSPWATATSYHRARILLDRRAGS